MNKFDEGELKILKQNVQVVIHGSQRTGNAKIFCSGFSQQHLHKSHNAQPHCISQLVSVTASEKSGSTKSLRIRGSKGVAFSSPFFKDLPSMSDHSC